MRIHVYGCSWSGGVPEVDNFNNWPRELAKLEPDWQIYNFGLGGTSSHFAMYNLFWSKRWTKEPVYHIYQCTSPYRWTHITHDIDPINYLNKIENNYYGLCPQQEHNNIQDVILRYQLKRQDGMPNNVSEHYKNKLNYELDVQWELDRFAYFESARNNVDLAFFHRKQDQDSYNKYFDQDTMCIESILGDTKFDDYCEDNGMHFGRTGLEWQSNYIREYIKDSIR